MAERGREREEERERGRGGGEKGWSKDVIGTQEVKNQPHRQRGDNKETTTAHRSPQYNLGLQAGRQIHHVVIKHPSGNDCTTPAKAVHYSMLTCL